MAYRRMGLALLSGLIATKAYALTLAAAGDVMVESRYAASASADGTHVLEAAAPYFQHADIGFANLEGVLLDENIIPRGCGSSGSCYRFRMPTRVANQLAAAGIRVVSSANNHSGDFGEQGRRNTVQSLLRAGVASIGLTAAPSTILVTSRGTRVAVIGFSPHQGTLSLFDYLRMAQEINRLKAQASVVVVSMHAGAEGPRAWHVPREPELFLGDARGDVYAFAHAAVDAGADLVLGHGPHVLRGMELYKGRLIAYSLGNFATNGPFSLTGVQRYGGILQVDLDDQTGAYRTGRFVGFSQDATNKARGPVPDRQAQVVLQDINRRSFPEARLTIAADGQLHWPPPADNPFKASR